MRAESQNLVCLRLFAEQSAGSGGVRGHEWGRCSHNPGLEGENSAPIH
eukprot:COSAG01_NODE_73555_length_242_cov_8.811189_1_plen_47_part_10